MMVAVASCISQLKWRHMQLGPQPLRHLQIFDDASRGPWGSTVMLFRVSLGSVIGWCLALITVAGLGIEPSAQNVVDIQLRTVNLTNLTAEISIARSWDSKAFVQVEDGMFGERGMTLGLPHLQGVVLNSLSGQVLQPSFACPSPAVNCTWESFTSLGICTDFHNVTEGVTCNCTGDFVMQNCTYENITGWPGTGPTEQAILEYQNPSSSAFSVLKTQILYAEYGMSDGDLLGPWLIIRHDSPYWDQSKYVDYADPPSPQLFTATFSYCVKAYTGVGTADPVSKGQLDSKIKITSQPLHCCGSDDLTEGSYVMEYHYCTADKSSSFNVTKAAQDGLIKYLYSVLSRKAYKYLRSSSRSSGYAYDSAMNVNFLLQNTEDLESIANNLGEALTNLIRNNDTGDNNASTTATGTAFGTEQFVVVRWEWLILPALETLLASALLIICIIVTSTTITTGNGTKGSQSQPQPLLKTSVIAYLTYPLSGWTNKEMATRGKQTGENRRLMATTILVSLFFNSPSG